MPVYQQAKSVAIFLSMPGREVSTRDIVLHALDNGKSVFVPYLHAGETPNSKVMDMLQLQDKKDFQSLKSDAWNIPSLSNDSVDNRRNALGGTGVSKDSSTSRQGGPVLDLMFMPAVAFDQSHRRLGHGKGFYDRYLFKYKTQLESGSSGKSMPALGKQPVLFSWLCLLSHLFKWVLLSTSSFWRLDKIFLLTNMTGWSIKLWSLIANNAKICSAVASASWRAYIWLRYRYRRRKQDRDAQQVVP